MKTFLLTCLMTIVAASSAPVFAQPKPAPVERSPRYKVEAIGQAPANRPNARDAAVEDALRRAVESAGGVQVHSRSQAGQFTLVDDLVIAESGGIIEAYVVLAENPDQDGLYTVRISAVVSQSREQIAQRVNALRTALKRKGNPRLLLIGAVDRRPFDEDLARKAGIALRDAGFNVVHLAMLDQRKRDEIDRAVGLSNDALRAALINKEIGADYYMVLGLSVRQDPPEMLAGQRMYRLTAEGATEVIRPDSSTLLTGQTVSASLRTTELEAGLAQVKQQAILDAVQKTVPKIALEWLRELDSREGQQIEIVAANFSFPRLAHLMMNLRKVPGIREVVGGETDDLGRSFLRVTTHSSAVDVASILVGLDSTLRITRTSMSRIEIEGDGSALDAPPPRPHLHAVVIWTAGITAGVLILMIFILMAIRHSRGAPV